MPTEEKKDTGRAEEAQTNSEQGKRTITEAEATVISAKFALLGAVIGAVALIIVALINNGRIPFISTANDSAELSEAEVLQAQVQELQEQLDQTIPAPKGSSELWTDPETDKKHRYWACSGYPDWEDAEAFCNSIGGHLATITSANEQYFIENTVLADIPSATLWIGVRLNNGMREQWVIREEYTGQFSNWNEHEFLQRNPGEYGAIRNMQSTLRWEVDGEKYEVKVDDGQWVSLILDANTRKSTWNSDGWLICEWDYD